MRNELKPILIYPPEEARRNSFVVEKIERELGAKLKSPDYRGDALYVINRTNDYKIAEYYEQRGVRVFNPSVLSKIANDKQLCYDFMEKNGIEIMPTHYKNPPFVKKPRDGHGGAGVVWCDSAEDYDENAVCQMPASDTGKDLRVWIINNKIITAILRESKTDFRSNYCLGGRATPYNLSNEEIEKISEELGVKIKMQHEDIFNVMHRI